MRFATPPSRAVQLVLAAVLLSPASVVVLSGCSTDDLPGVGGGDQTTAAPDPAAVADSSLTDPAENASSNATLEQVPGFKQVDANTASPAELMAAFEANGIADAATWAEQVVDHRPYATGDPSGAFDDLRAALAATGLDEFTVEAIAASLTA